MFCEEIVIITVHHAGCYWNRRIHRGNSRGLQLADDVYIRFSNATISPDHYVFGGGNYNLCCRYIYNHEKKTICKNAILLNKTALVACFCRYSWTGNRYLFLLAFLGMWLLPIVWYIIWLNTSCAPWFDPHFP